VAYSIVEELETGEEGELFTGEYRAEIWFSLCQEGPYRVLEEQKAREQHWWALIAQPV
jgi:hypothetical protein